MFSKMWNVSKGEKYIMAQKYIFQCFNLQLVIGLQTLAEWTYTDKKPSL
jgi:hypothetical protein